MSTPKQEYVRLLRASTSYPTYRGIIKIITYLLYALAVIQGMASIGGAIALGDTLDGAAVLVGIIGLIAAVISFFLARFFKEGALILADIGDSITETNAKVIT